MKHFQKFIKRFYLPLLAVGMIALIYFGVNGVKAELGGKNQQSKSARETPLPSLNIVGLESPSPEASSQQTTLPQKTEIVVESSPKVKNIALQKTVENQEKVIIKINAGRRAGSYSVDYIAGESAFQLLLRVAKNDVEYTDWGGDLGIFVDGIGGVRRTDKYEYCWFFYINGKLSEVGSSQYFVKPNDVIEWRYGEAY